MTQGYVPSRRFPDAPPLSPDNPGRLVPAILGNLPGALPGRAGAPSAAAAASPMKMARETVPASTALVGALVNGLPFGNQTPPPGMMMAPAAAPAPAIPPAPITPPAAVVAPPAFVGQPAEANGAEPAPPPRVLTPPPGLVGGLSTGGGNGAPAVPTPAMGVEPMKPAFIGEPEPPPRVAPMVGAPTNEEAPPSSGRAAAAAAPEVSPWMREVGQPASAYKPEPAPEPVASPVPLSPVSRTEPKSSSSRLPIVLVALLVVLVGAGAAGYLIAGRAKPSDKSPVTAPATTSAPGATAATATPTPETAQPGGTEAAEPTPTAPAPTGETLKSPPPPPPQPGVGGGRLPPTKPTTAPPAGGQKFDPSGI